jgi:glycosyltransferase involved in cell wall biosynthesis
VAPLRTCLDLRRFDRQRPRGPASYAFALADALAEVAPPEAFRLTRAEDRGEPEAPDLVLSLDGPGRLRYGPRHIVAAYDVGHLLARSAYSPRRWLAQSWQLSWASRQAAHLLAPSESVRQALVRYLRVPAARVTLVPPGVQPGFRRSARGEVEALRRELRLPERYLLFVGTLGRRKNLELLVRAWTQARPSLGPRVGLVLAGEPGPDSGARLAQLAVSTPGARWLGYVPPDRMRPLLSGAVALLDPSLCEGCPMGVLEAMACGTPPLVSSAGALAEPLRSAGLVLDPADESAWAGAMVLLATRDEVRASLSRKAARAAAGQTAAASATALLSALESAAGIAA